jgi:hypothetical protein
MAALAGLPDVVPGGIHYQQGAADTEGEQDAPKETDGGDYEVLHKLTVDQAKVEGIVRCELAQTSGERYRLPLPTHRFSMQSTLLKHAYSDSWKLHLSCYGGERKL